MSPFSVEETPLAGSSSRRATPGFCQRKSSKCQRVRKHAVVSCWKQTWWPAVSLHEHPQDKTLLMDHVLSCVVPVTEKKLSSDLGPSKLIVWFLFFYKKKKKSTHTWLLCGVNVFITLLITHGVILAGLALWYGCSSFCHSDKSSIVLKPLEISLLWKEICLLLGCVGERK